MRIGPQELIIVLIIVLVIFGPKNLPKLGKMFGKTMNNFKKGMDESQVTGTASSYARKYALNGLFAIDDTKDADTDEYARETGSASGRKPPAAAKPAEAAKKPEMLFKCSACGKEITGETINGHAYSAMSIAEQTTKKFGRCFCWGCAQKQGKGNT